MRVHFLVFSEWLFTWSVISPQQSYLTYTRLITIAHTWRTIYYVSVALIGSLLILAFFTFPETNFIRQVSDTNFMEKVALNVEKSDSSVTHLENGNQLDIPGKKTYFQLLKVFSGTYTSESLLNLFIRPVALILLPPVLWGSLVMSVTIGFLVAVTSNVAPAYATAYGFAAYQTGLCFFAAIVGSLIGILVGGHMSDKIADMMTKRNRGIREPEMRLPAIVVSLITTPLGLLIFGAGIQYQLHWICPTIGLGLCKSFFLSFVRANDLESC